MPYSLFDTRDEGADLEEKKVFGVAVAQVVSNRDFDRLGAVQVRFSWLPGIEPWARVASLMGGDGRGTYFIPQEGDEVLCAFHHGDVREPYIIGGLWNGEDKPPTTGLTDPTDKFMIRTPKKHELILDDAKKVITVRSLSGHVITIGSDKVEIADDKDGTHRVTLNDDGITIKATRGDITLEAPSGAIQIKASRVQIQGSSQTELSASQGECVVRGRSVRIN